MEKPRNNPENELAREKKEFSVFVVDDDESFLFALGFHLKKDTSWKIYCYPSVEECLCFLHLNPSAIVMDYYFDKAGENSIDGMTALKMIRELKPKVPVIMLSGQADVKVSLDLLKSGAFTYIVKDKKTLAGVERTLISIRENAPEEKSVRGRRRAREEP